MKIIEAKVGNISTRQKIVKYIFQTGKVSKTEIANTLSLSMPTVLNAVQELTKENIVRETGSFESTGGRRAKKIAIVGEHIYALGMDITANHVSMVMVDMSGKVVARSRIREKFENSLEYFEHLCGLLDQFIENVEIDVEDKILGVGISFPGIIDKEKEILVRSHALQVEDLGLKNISQLMRFPVLYENDANSAAFAEMRNEQGDAVYLSLSNTVGGAIFLNGTVYEGANYRSAEFGHMILEHGGRPCYCGRIGCVDAYCSAKRLSDLTDGNLELFFERLEGHDCQCLKAWDEYLEYLAVAVSNLRIIFDCDVILGGYVGGYMEKYLGLLRKKILRHSLFDKNVTFVKSCQTKKEASAVGIAMKFIDSYIMSI